MDDEALAVRYSGDISDEFVAFDYVNRALIIKQYPVVVDYEGG